MRNETSEPNGQVLEQAEMIELIACRPGDELGHEFAARMNALEVTSSELAKRAIKFGLDKACREIAAEKTKAAQAVLNRLAPKGRKRPFNRPLTPYRNNTLTVRLSKAKLSSSRMGS